jgi:hypothetical protein
MIMSDRSKAMFMLLITAAIVGACTIVKIKEMGDPTPQPTPVPTVITGTVAPSPLCQDAASSQCWETVNEVGPPWIWREKARVR